MRRYNVKPQWKSFPWGEMEVLILGERGRGRKQVVIPFSALEKDQYLDIAQTRSGNPKIVGSAGQDGWLARISSAGAYSRGTYGTLYAIPPGEGVSVIAMGSGAYGDAGRIGSYNDFLLKVRDNTFIKVRPSGGSRIRRYWLYFGEGEVSRIEKEEMDIFCEFLGVDRPSEEFDNLLDISKTIT